MSCLHFRGKSS